MILLTELEDISTRRQRDGWPRACLLLKVGIMAGFTRVTSALSIPVVALIVYLSTYIRLKNSLLTVSTLFIILIKPPDYHQSIFE
jgi:hypothetical protein